MAFTLDFSLSRDFDVLSDYDAAFSLLSDVPKALSFHPNTEEVLDRGDNIYTVLMKKLGTQKHHFQMSYTSKYEFSHSEGYIAWTPVRSDEYAVIDGKFTLSSKEPNLVRVNMTIVSQLRFPLPKLMKGMAEKFASNENQKMSDSYIENIIRHFGGGEIVNSHKPTKEVAK